MGSVGWLAVVVSALVMGISGGLANWFMLGRGHAVPSGRARSAVGFALSLFVGAMVGGFLIMAFL